VSVVSSDNPTAQPMIDLCQLSPNLLLYIDWGV